MESILQAIQSIDLGNAALIGVVCACLCGVLVVLGILLQFLSGTLELVVGVFEFIFQIISGGPLAWCGCLLMILGICACAFCGILFFSAIQTCGTPDALNICRLLG